ncbi:isochorismate synthase [Rhodocyclus tenuis]|uniref:isochorismate synthase n=1 Tax=Rhodocyclus gracilis TaxID=2929842 RepID=A0ABX0WE94_9RHOO|nr:isochorismate synthase [Rhodocyclus gracilis]
MRLPPLLDPAQRHVLRARLAAQLVTQLADAPPHALISLTLTLGEGHCRWLDARLDDQHAFWWARPDTDEWRLALGQAMIVTSAGPNRFTALQAAFAGISADWRHHARDCGDSGNSAARRLPAAHLGFAFDDEAQDDLPNARLIVPAVLLVSRGGKITATFSCPAREGEAAVDAWLDTLRRSFVAIPNSAAGTAHRPPNLPPQRQPAPLDDRAFLARVTAALAEIASGRVRKLVVSRRVRLRAKQPIALAPVLAAFAERHPACTVYAVTRPGMAFIGATPERLIALDDGIARADALAGTAWAAPEVAALRTGEAAPTESFALDDDKNSREQGLVVDAVRSALAPLCQTLEQAAAPEVLRLRDLQHLRTQFAGHVRTGVDLFDLIAALHPTPAVGGTPSLAAQRWLRAHRDTRPAWFTGGVGWIDAGGNGEVVVALRCARISGGFADCYAGVGIVPGSRPEQEFAETEIKLTAALDALQCRPHPALESAPTPRTGT